MDKPRDILHTTSGYLVGAAALSKYVFNIYESDPYFYASHIGWITGNTYVIYAPLLLSIATVVFGGYIRLLKRAGSDP